MARIKYDGIGELVKDLEGYADDIDELSNATIEFAGENMRFHWIKEVMRRDFVDSQDMVRSIKRLPMTKRRRDGRYVEVGATGTDHKGVRNAQKAFILNYGSRKRNIKPSGYVTDIRDASAKEIDAFAAQKHAEILRRRKL